MTGTAMTYQNARVYTECRGDWHATDFNEVAEARLEIPVRETRIFLKRCRQKSNDPVCNNPTKTTTLYISPPGTTLYECRYTSKHTSSMTLTPL